MAAVDIKSIDAMYKLWARAQFRIKALAYFDRIRKDERLWR